MVEILQDPTCFRMVEDLVRSHKMLLRILNDSNPNHVLKDPTQDPVKPSRILYKFLNRIL